MYLTKTEIKILKLCCAKLSQKYTIRAISREIKQSFPIIYHSVQNLLKQNLLLKDEHKLISLHYQHNFPCLAYIESLRTEDFLARHKEIKLFNEEVLKKMENFYTMLIFGSYADNTYTPRSDVDILMIIDRQAETEQQEKFLKRIADIYLPKAHIQVISQKDARELIKEKNLNVMKETMDKHLILFGAEDYYRFIA